MTGAVAGGPEPRQAAPGNSVENFVDKWRARWPEWAIAQAFVPRDQRQTALAWAAVQQELTDAAWGGEDPRPGEAKLGWWQEELVGWGRGARRHPLGALLQRRPAPWPTLAAALPALAASRERPRDREQAFAALQGFAEAVCAVEAELFGSAGDDAHGREVVAATVLQSRLLQPGDAGVPLSVLARAGEGDRRGLWARELARAWPTGRAGNRPRRLWATLARARLARVDVMRPLSAWQTLRLAWRAARG